MLEVVSSSILISPSATMLGMTLGERIDLRLRELKEAGKDVAGLATACSVTPSAVYQWIDGTSKGLKPENLVVTAEYLQTHCRWLVFERGPKDRRVKGTDLADDEEALVADFRLLSPENRDAMVKTIAALARGARTKRGRKNS